MNSITQKDRGAPDAPYHTCVPVGAVCAGTSPHSASIPALIVTRDLHERRPPPSCTHPSLVGSGFGRTSRGTRLRGSESRPGNGSSEAEPSPPP